MHTLAFFGMLIPRMMRLRGEKYEYLKKVLDDSHYTVALCGSGILAETGCRTFQNQDYAYEIEQKYGRSPEDIFASAYYMTRPDSFFEFYRAEVLEKDWKPSESCYALKKLEDAGKIQCILSDNTLDLSCIFQFFQCITGRCRKDPVYFKR